MKIKFFYLDKDESCLTVFASEPFVTHSNSEGSGNSEGIVPLVT